MKYLFILLLTITAFAFDYPITLQEVALYSGDLAGYWKLQGNALDYSGNGNNGTVVGAVSTGTNYYFDGTLNNYIRLNSEIIFTNDMTLSLWLNGKNYTEKTFNFFIGKYDDKDNFLCINDNENLYIQDFGNNNIFCTGYNFTSNNTYNICLAIQSDRYYLYVDGAFIESKVFINSVLINAIGRGYDVYDHNFQGYIKDVRIYDRALTSNEISNIYNETLPKHTINLFDSKPATVTDLSDEGNDGVNHGATMTDDGMSFNGIDDYIASKDIRPTELTISMWLYLTEDTVGGCIGKYYNAGGFSYRIKRNGNQLEYHMNSIANSARIPIGDNTQKWIHVTVTYDKEYQRIYINNIEGTPLANTVEIPYNVNLVYLGRALLGTYLKCKEDNVAIYDRVITSDERAALVAAGRNASKDVISTNGLVLFYDFNVPERTLTLQEKTFFYKDMLVWYPFIEGGEDAGPNGYNATIPAEWDYSNKVYTADNAHYSNASHINLVEDKTEITVSGWYKIHAYTNTTSDMASLIGEWKDWWASSSMDNFTVGFDSRNGKVKAKIWPTIDKVEILGTTTVPLDTWAFVTMVYDGLTLKIYLNGNLENTVTAELGAFDNSTYPLRLGYNNYSRLDADIRDIRAYNKALTDEEVLILYNGTK